MQAKGAQQSGRTGRVTAAVTGVTVGGRYRGTNAMRYYKWVVHQFQLLPLFDGRCRWLRCAALGVQRAQHHPVPLLSGVI